MLTEVRHYTYVLVRLWNERAVPSQGYHWLRHGSLAALAALKGLRVVERSAGFVRALDADGRAYGLMFHPERPGYAWAAPLP